MDRKDCKGVMKQKREGVGGGGGFSPAFIIVMQAVAAHPAGSVHQVNGSIPKLQAAMHSIPGQARLRPCDAALSAQQVVGQRRLALPNSNTLT